LKEVAKRAATVALPSLHPLGLCQPGLNEARKGSIPAGHQQKWGKTSKKQPRPVDPKERQGQEEEKRRLEEEDRLRGEEKKQKEAEMKKKQQKRNKARENWPVQRSGFSCALHGNVGDGTPRITILEKAETRVPKKIA